MVTGNRRPVWGNTLAEDLDFNGFGGQNLEKLKENLAYVGEDYEEGNWTPSISFGWASVGVTYSTQLGRYIKIGKLVRVAGFIDLLSKGSSTGTARIEGLPFRGRYEAKTAVSLYLQNVTFADVPQGWINYLAVVALHEVTTAGTVTILTDADFSDTSRVAFSASYEERP